MKIAANELLERYAAGERNFAGISINPPYEAREFLRGANLSVFCEKTHGYADGMNHGQGLEGGGESWS